MSKVRITRRCTAEHLPELPKSIRTAALKKLRNLAGDPKSGKPLTGDLRPYRTVRVGRYRIVYRYDPTEDVVWVVLIAIRREGSRNDVYERLLKDLQSGKVKLE
ncbi:MAG: type II toxin-antitoxin system RelE/ParE family toxin [Chloroflexi bacterium]|nr:type II toxin-antitoxin system RelE/ParE family toxin [Chloroflexota bacterium]